MDDELENDYQEAEEQELMLQWWWLQLDQDTQWIDNEELRWT
jgi:hypothetical protein